MNIAHFSTFFKKSTLKEGMNQIMAETIHKTTAELRALLKEGQTAEQAALAKEGKLCARDRMAMIFDEGTFVEVGAYIGRKRTELDRDEDDSFEPVITGYGAVNGELVYAFSQDYSRLHGALGEMHAKKIVKIIEMADIANAPLIGVFDSAGAKILEGVDALAGYGAIMSALTVDIPKIAVVSGTCGGASAVLAELFDIVIAAEKTAKIFAAPSGAKADGIAASSELYDIVCADDAASLAMARKLIAYFGEEYPTADDANRLVDIEGILAADAYNVRDIIAATFDVGSFTELGAHRAKSMVTGLATMNGAPVVVVANNPEHKDGAICACAAKKAVKALDLAFALEVPVITLVDSVGVADKAETEEKGLAKLLADLAKAYACVGDLAVTVVLGKAYGTAYAVMGSKSLTNNTALALDRAKISALSPESAVAFLDVVEDASKHQIVADEWAARYASPLEAAKSGHIDDIIEAAELRQRIGASLAVL